MRLHVLFVLWASTGPLVAKEIAQEINCCPDAVDQALPQLEFDGYVSRLPGGRHPRWWLTDKARQLSLPGLYVGGEVENLNFIAPTTTTALLDPLSTPKAVVAATAEVEKINLNPALAAAIRVTGIGKNMWAELSGYEWVTPAFVRGHDQYRRSRGESTGMLITRLRAGDMVPVEVKKADCRAVADEWQEVLGKGKYAKVKREK